MNILLRIILLIFLAFAGHSYATTTAVVYDCGVNAFQTGVGNLNNDGLINPSGCCRNSSSRDSQDRAQARFFFALAASFDVTKGLVDTKTIRFTQDTIGLKFSDERSVQALIEGLKSGKISPNDLPAIRTFQKDGLTFTLDNRRLFAAHQAGVKVKTVPATAAEIAKELPRKFTTRNDGTIIGIRGALE